MTSCDCSTEVKLIYSCSGAADVGELADRAVSQLRKEGIAQVSCIAGIGAELSGYVQSAKGADIAIAIDGCPTACSKKILEKIGVTPVAINLVDLGYKKGESAFSIGLLESAVNDIKNVLNGDKKKPDLRINTSGSCGCGGKC